MTVVDTNSLLRDAVQLHQEQRFPEAADLYARVLALDPRVHAARHNLGMVLLGLGEQARALPLLRRALVEDGDNPAWRDSLRTIGDTLYRQGLWEEALPWYERALPLWPGDTALREHVARLRPRDYLEAEIRDQLGGQVLRRYTPRESPSWVYAIDIVGTCNLRCPTCPVGNSAASERPKGFMELALFERIVAKIGAEAVTPQPEIFLFNWGEPLLHPQLGDIIRCAQTAGFPVQISSNLNVERGLRELARANPAAFKISLSGFTQDTYGVTHRRGDINLVKANMYLLRHFLDKYKATTRVWVGQHLYRNNQHQVEQVAAVCRELGFEHHPIAAFYQPLEQLLRIDRGETVNDPVLDLMLEHPAQYLPRIRANRSGRYDCELRFNQTAINFDGSVALCCSVYEKENMLGVSFLDHGHEELQELKYRHPFCRTCIARGLSYAPAEIV